MVMASPGLYRYMFLIALVLSIHTSWGQERTEEKTDPTELLKRWNGEWTTNTLFKKSVWFPKRIKAEGTTTVEFIMNERYQQSRSETGEQHTLELTRFDNTSGKFKKWVFEEDGTTSTWLGRWDDSASTMTWTYVDFTGSGLYGKMIERFKKENVLQISITLEDSDGNRLLDVEITQVREK